MEGQGLPQTQGDVSLEAPHQAGGLPQAATRLLETPQADLVHRTPVEGAQILHGEELLQKVMDALLEEETMSDDSLIALHSILQQNLVPALDLVERRAVTKYVCSCVAAAGYGTVTRQLYLVKGSSGNQYVCLASSSYCSCPSFMFSVLGRGDALLCKHQLAVRLATAMGACPAVELSGEEWAGLAKMDTQ